jgi:hypothetical protein
MGARPRARRRHGCSRRTRSTARRGSRGRAAWGHVRRGDQDGMRASSSSGKSVARVCPSIPSTRDTRGDLADVASPRELTARRSASSRTSRPAVLRCAGRQASRAGCGSARPTRRRRRESSPHRRTGFRGCAGSGATAAAPRSGSRRALTRGRRRPRPRPLRPSRRAVIPTCGLAGRRTLGPADIPRRAQGVRAAVQ